MAETRDGFTIAHVFDGTNNGEYYVVDREPLPREQRDSVLAYLHQGENLMMARSLGEDRLDPSRGRQVPRGASTDGRWIWDASIAYYLREHELSPEPAFIAYLRERNFHYEAPTPEQVTAALAALQTR
ncbi:conserved hypothetical protein [Frankia canadensis]|uniref:Uncharacterized protein n=1 Tax=Frankia canadensis TaxID=1836972 RepID=A0A2I2KLI9_9ACTN|nr:hypothetical protein [Frankia canadensis]SNQ46528.1 conserved hypothetical protein [Frankia canadensis]SOU53818.1 conserved hypothetical protein [Frankia canadensis]